LNAAGRLALALVLAAAAMPRAAAAQSGGGLGFGLSGGVTLPQQDAKDSFKNGYHVQGHLFYGLPALSILSLRVDGAYNKLDAKKIEDLSGDARVVSGTGNVVLGVNGGSVRPYAIGGAGVYSVRFRSTLGSFESRETQTKFGWNAGVGAGLTAGRATIFLEGRYHRVSTQGAKFTYVPITVGVLFH